MTRSAREPETVLRRLLADETDLRRLAGRLGAREQDAEDATQDAALHVLREAGPSPRSPAAWWSRVIRNRTLDLHRERLRRRAREQASARDELQPSVVDALVRAELMRDLSEELQSLTTQDRAALVLRYIDERPLREVAAEFGEPVETVRKRLARARERLRDRLRARWGSHWQASCLLFAYPSGNLLPGTSAPLAPVLAMQAMKKWSAALVAVLSVLAVAAFCYFAGPEPNNAPDATERTAALAASAHEGDSDSLPENPPGRREVEDEASPIAPFLFLDLPPRRFGFTGRVVDAETREPVPHATVYGDEQVGWLETDEHGRFTCLQDTDWRRSVSFFAVADGYAGAHSGNHRAAAPAREVTLELQRGAEVLVRVLGKPLGRPMAGVVVQLDSNRETSLAQTGPDGIAHLTARVGEERGATLPVTIETIYGPVWGRRFTCDVIPGNGAIHDVVAEIYPRDAVIRVVEAGSGNPIPEARCARRIVPHGLRTEGVSFARLLSREAQGSVAPEPSTDGLWRFQLPDDEPFLDLEASAPGYHPGGLSIIAPSPSGVHELRLWKLVPQPVRVLARGQALERPATVHVELTSLGSTSYTEQTSYVPGTGPSHAFTGNRVMRSFTTDAAGVGRIELPPRVPQRIFVRVALPDGRSREFGGLLRRDIPEGPWTFDVDPGHVSFRVRVQDPDGRPLADREVAAQTWGPEGAVERGTFLSERTFELGLADFGRTDEAGSVELTLLDLSGGDVSIVVSTESSEERAHVRPSIEAAIREGATVTVNRTPTGRIEGRVVPRAGGFPEERWRVELTANPVAGGESRDARIAPDGSFSIDGLEPGVTYRLAQRAAIGIEPIEVETGARGVEVTIPEISTLEVEIVDDLTGEPVHVRLFGRAGSPPSSIGYQPRAAGHATFGPEAADWVAVRSEAHGYETAQVELEPGQRRVTVRMKRRE